MPKRLVALPRTEGMQFDIVSYGRRGPGVPWHFSPAQVDQIQRTVRRVPEVMVKVSGGGRDAGGVLAHLKYIDRHGKLPIETDDGRAMEGRDAAEAVATDWNLDLLSSHHRPKPVQGQKDTRSKLVHNIVLSMPGQTPPDAVLAAAKRFARENFALQYRYAMVLHTDQAHPHVHLVVKAEHEFEPRKRLHIRKATLRSWREQFAACLREEGVAANATPRPQRGQLEPAKKDPIHHRLRAMVAFRKLSEQDRTRTSRRPPVESSFMRRKVEAIGKELQSGRLEGESGKQRMASTRDKVVGDWAATAASLRRQGLGTMAQEVERFIQGMPAVQTEQERIARGMVELLAKGRRPPERSRDD